jgi:uncharacterized protein (DUF488 family)
MPSSLYTVGHSNHPLPHFLALLTASEIQSIADVRRFPGSRRHPHFSQAALSESLNELGIAYQHFPALGGRRSAKKDDTANNAWRVPAFAAYASYMLSPEFGIAFTELSHLASNSRTAIMCSEALPWRCHRRLIADQFLAAGWQVFDIIGPNNTKPHELPSFAKIEGNRLTYPGEPRPLFDG